MKKTPITRKTPLKKTPFERGRVAQWKSNPDQASPGSTPGTPSLKRKKGFAASNAQQNKVKVQACVMTGRDVYEDTVDPAHVWPRGRGGCDHEDCVVPLVRTLHIPWDDPNQGLNILPALIADRRYTELAHAADHADWNLPDLLHRLTGEKWSPESEIRRRIEAALEGREL